MKSAGPNSTRRFLVHCQDYVDAVAREAELREKGEVLDMEAFRDLRRENSAIRLCFGLFEFALGVDLPDQIFKDEAFMELYWAAADLVCWANVRTELIVYYSTCLLMIVPRMSTPTTWNRLKAITGTTSSPFL